MATPRKVDLLLVNDEGWLQSREDSLRQMLLKGGRLRICIPDPEDDTIISDLLKRFNKTDATLRNSIQGLKDLAEELRQDFPEVVNDSGVHVSGVKLELLRVAPTYSYYRIDDTGVLRVHEMAKAKATTPIMVFSRKGSIWQFGNKDFDTLLHPGRTDLA